MINRVNLKLLAILLIFFAIFTAQEAHALPVASSIYAKDSSGNFTATSKTINAGASIDFEIKSANTEGDVLSEVRLYITQAGNTSRDANGRLAAYNSDLCRRQSGTPDGFGNCYFARSASGRFSTEVYPVLFPDAGTYYVFTSAAKSYATQQAWCTGSPYCSWYTGPAGDNCSSYATECINPPGVACGGGSYQCSNAVTVTVNAVQPTDAPTAAPTNAPTNAPTQAPTARPTGAPIPALMYRIAETPAGLESDPYQSDPNRSRTGGYTGAGTLHHRYTFTNTAAGEKQLYVRFFYSTDLTKDFVDHGPFRIIYRPAVVVEDPKATAMSCITDISNPSSTRVTVSGTSFGTQAGTLKLGGIDGVVASGGWSQTSVVAVVPQKFTGSQEILLTRPDGKVATLPDGTNPRCVLDGSLVQFSANLTCRFVNRPVEKAAVEIITEAGSVGVGTSSVVAGQPVFKATNVEFDQNGSALNVAPTAKLIPNATYSLIIKAPYALRRKISFTAGALNTTKVLTGDSSNEGKYKLFLGDIFPSGSENVLSITGGDNSVSTSDYSILKSKWSPTSDIQTPADFNQDKRVNTIDYACISSNINKPGD